MDLNRSAAPRLVLAALALSLGLQATPTCADLFVSSLDTNQVLEYNGTTGSFVTAFVAAGSGGLAEPLGLVFGPNGNLFVVSSGPTQVLEYNGTTGVFVTTFVNDGRAGPHDLVFGPNGDLFVTSLGTRGPGIWGQRQPLRQ
jgi:glucose/arabinose dehydrogenase